MDEEMNETPEALPHHDLMDLFKEIAFREKVKKVFHGLGQPKDSGEYKYARFQIIRLSAPVAALVVPCLMVAMLMVFARMMPPPSRAVQVQIMEPESIEELDDIEELLEEPLEPPEPIEMDFTPDMVLKDNIIAPLPSTDLTPQLAEFDAVAMVRSPVIMKGIYGSRNPGARGSAIVEFGGSGITEGAVIRALRWLKKEQDQYGSWAHGAPAPAMTALALLTFLAHGEIPASEEFGLNVEKAIKWLVNAQEESGHFRGRDGHDYTHPIVTYAICEAYGLTKVPMLKDVAKKAVDLLIKGQHEAGLWDYNLRQSYRDDLSYGGWCIQALKAAKMAGLKNEGLDRAMNWAIEGCKKNAAPNGGFGYTDPGAGGLTGVGVLCMQLMGAGSQKETRQGLVWMEEFTCDWEEPWGRSPIYYWYYVTQAKFHAGGGVWNRWNKEFAVQLVINQTILKGEGLEGHDIGYWESCSEIEHCKSPVYNTTLCALMLQVYYRYLPTFKTPKDSVIEDIASEEDFDIEISI